jgi:glyoxylase-like metal-dependent hydrolase (beta-lactamase superfamily II)
MTRLISRLLFSVSLIAVSNLATGNEFKILPRPEKISKHVYAWIGPYPGPSVENKGYRMNLVFVVGKKYVAVLDSGYYPEMAREMLGRIRQITPLPVKYVLNSNSQPHRFMGNDVFRKAGAQIITSEKEARRMEENANNYAMMLENIMKFKQEDIRLPAAPDILLNKGTSLDLGGNVILDVHIHKAAHTPQPLITHISIDNIVYAGDILYSGRLLSIVSGSNIKEWKQTYNYLKQFKSATFIPGHGQPAKLSEFEKSTYQYLDLLDSHMSKMVEEGVDLQDAINRLDQSAYSHLEIFEMLAGRNASRAYLEAERASFE